MKKFLFIAIAALTMASTAVATESRATIENETVVNEPNIFDKMLETFKNFIKKMNAAQSIDELKAIAEEFQTWAAANLEEIEKEEKELEQNLSDEELDKYNKLFEKLLHEFEETIKKKVAEFGIDTDSNN